MANKKSLQFLRKLKGFLGKTPYPVVSHRVNSKYLTPEGETWVNAKSPNLLLIYGRRKRQPYTEASVLIHEYGHHGAEQIFGGRHTELDAWHVGRVLVPPHLVPKSYRKIQNDYMNSATRAQRKTHI